MEDLQEGRPLDGGEIWGLEDCPLLPEITQAGGHSAAGQAKFSVAQVPKPIQRSENYAGER